ncbi:putative mitochondrial ATP-dependent chaperone, putative,mitochondrial chaperone BCS1 [Leptomonas pyrrhocoris]|uniref:Putative mitochondrial ATP-dependent chaperone, putative,mitochondrial chaperone BCS1 n=1 Tax=Leptomonas pyrrhocoris TaxID=157538 RepID=A0A0N0VFV5_LEPPY|nr:putative mitochondrial ATP-dependent chaperone, putative,mitochondrial chaperone BCS1 [Leptomonas pyrrhocoris]KPA82201.1 putative mitochondrial ATP-dependent chaperone, putative,mitochondrial chaperone BCS1 [Leptomonas pyrrhocoris]|eukprot:XP_015660640.1 putative mitochondrial ATP-dependent chaperone, putative,mitochondrial chaperone BCS1 [Leptomonas pyrrhocoris]
MFTRSSSNGADNAATVVPAADTAATPAANATSASQPPIDLGALLPEGWENSNSVMARTAGALLSNPYFSAGAGLWVLTVGGMLSRQASVMLSTLMRRKFVVSLEVSNRDSGYEWMLRWLASQRSFKVQQMSVLTRTTAFDYSSNDRQRTECLFGPCPNLRHFFFYEGRPLTLTRRRRDNVGPSYDGEIFETLEFTTVGTSPVFLQNIMKAAQLHAEMEDSNHTVVYMNGGSNWTRQTRPRSRRSLQSVVLSGDTSDFILKDVHRFLDSAAFYKQLGVPYRRGYLLHGPPGCGKTSYVMALAGELRLSISLLNLSNRNLNDESLTSLLNNAHMDSIVLLEDIDRAFSNECNVTMSGLLNALDGVGAQEGRLVFMTTNHVEMLDPALIRPGRADVKIEVGLLDVDQSARMFRKFYPTAPDALVAEFGSAVPPHRISAAQLQSHLFYYRDDPVAATRALPAFIESNLAFDESMQQMREKKKKMQALPRAPLLDFE